MVPCPEQPLNTPVDVTPKIECACNPIKVSPHLPHCTMLYVTYVYRAIVITGDRGYFHFGCLSLASP